MSGHGFTHEPITELQVLAHQLAKDGQRAMQEKHPKCAVIVVCVTPDSLLSPDVAISGQLSHEGTAMVLKQLAQQMAIDLALARERAAPPTGAG